MDSIDIQLQDSTGDWRTYYRTINQPQTILARMRELACQFPKHRIRAVDDKGRVIDIL